MVKKFHANFRKEFLAANYEWRLGRVGVCVYTQHPDESLLEYEQWMNFIVL